MGKFKYFEDCKAGHSVVHANQRNMARKLWVTRLALAKLLSVILLMSQCKSFVLYFYKQGK